MVLIRRLLPAALPLLLATAPGEPAHDWAAAVRRDARAMHDDIVANHPGPHDRANPGFARLNDAAFALALRRAARVTSETGYRAVLDGYAAAFDDGHVSVGPAGEPPAVSYRWPGFLTAFDTGGAQVVATRADDAPVPLGARLIACDGRPAAALAAANVGAFAGRWQLASTRARWGSTLFVDAGNPFIRRPSRCIFAVGTATRAVMLDWRPIAPAALDARRSATGGRAHPPIGEDRLADGTRWFRLGDFDGDPASAAGRALPPLIAAMRADRTALANARAVVLDLRGNNGGSSDWSRQIATVLWGGAAVGRVGAGDRVEWRASSANIATMAAARDRELAGGHGSAEMRGWFDRAVAGMTAARAAGRPLWREEEPAPVRSTQSPPPPLAGRIFVLTDTGCASACLDAVDLWRALGAVQVGQETSADTLYMDIRSDRLPSGLSTLYLPMKVYRGRARGSNMPWTPTWRYTGDLRDTAAVQAWVADLR